MNDSPYTRKYDASEPYTTWFHVAAFALAAAVAVPLNGVIMNAMAAYKYSVLPSGLFVEGAIFIAAIGALCVWLACGRQIRRSSLAVQRTVSGMVCVVILLGYAAAKVGQFVYFM